MKKGKKEKNYSLGIKTLDTHSNYDWICQERKRMAKPEPWRDLELSVKTGTAISL